MKKYFFWTFLLIFLFLVFYLNPPKQKKDERYPIHKDIISTVFWVGEEASNENNYISNKSSAWDSDWVESFGGVDNPDERNGWFPKDFIPKENPFYVALPYSDYDENGRKENVTKIPWYREELVKNGSFIKNRWVKIIKAKRECYAQWENSGPFLSDDSDYVFGNRRPRNKWGQGAGIDISPAVRDCLGVGLTSTIDWQFVDENEVPDGPWKLVITSSNPRWEE